MNFLAVTVALFGTMGIFNRSIDAEQSGKLKSVASLRDTSGLLFNYKPNFFIRQGRKSRKSTITIYVAPRLY